MRAKWSRCIGLGFVAIALTACSPDPGDPVDTSDSSSSAEVEPTETSVPTSSLTPDEQAAADSALAAYNGGWEIRVLAQRDPGAKPDWRLDFQQFYAEPLLSSALATLYGLRDAGLRSPTGEPARAPVAAEVDIEQMQVTITDCVDTRPWPSIDATGAVVSTEQPPRPLTARAYYDTQLARWLVVEQEADLEATC